MITPGQCRAARAFLQWSREELAEKAEIATRTVVDFERGEREPIRNTLKAIQAAFEAAGVTFSDAGCVCPPAKQKGSKKK